MTCQGFQAATYDLYVLGLLDRNQRTALDSHVRDRCPVCIQGVQRSMRLWLVFASTLQDAEPSANFKTRLKEISQLSRNVLTFPKDLGIIEPNRGLRWPLIGLAVVLVAIAVLGGWRAGRASANLDERRLGNQVTNLNQDVASLQSQLQRENNERKHVTAALNSSGNAGAALQATRLASQLTEAQAEATQYRSLLEREQSFKNDNTELIEALSSPGVMALALKGTEYGAGYALMVPPSKLIFLASNLRKPAPDKEYQLWVIYKQSAAPASAAVFLPSEDGRVFLQIDDPTLTSNVAGLAVTDEPVGGSA
ncbi:MAG: anti-sigma factor, partial [Acidobacteriota bacterium]|nr:anti-sigma factor [Acidobacteriota bacterium]